MAPVKQRSQRDPRAMVIAVSTLVVGVLALLGLFIYLVPSLTESDRIEVRLGPEVFTAGNVDNLYASVKEAPLLLPDVASGERDIYLQHVGTDALSGWLAFDARRSGQSRDCTLVWVGERAVFVDPCDDVELPADGAGLRTYPVEVTDDRQVVVDLRTDAERQAEADARAGDEDGGETTTTSIEVTGTLRR